MFARKGPAPSPMIRQLRRKLVTVILLIATVMLCVLFGLIYRSTQANLADSSVEMLRRVALEPRKKNLPGPFRSPEDFRLPYFILSYDEEGTLLEATGENYDLDDTASLQQILSTALAQDRPTGILKHYALRYLVLVSPHSRQVVFTDSSYEQASLQSLLRSFLFVGAAALLAFWVLGVLLARWVSKPVERAWLQQQQFVADASHELKTPLTVIMTNAELLSDEGYSPLHRDRCVSSILTMSQQMKVLVEEMLDLARTESSYTQLTLRPVNFSQLVEEELLPFEAIFYENNIHLVSHLQPNVTLVGDPQRLGQVLDILLDNARKYIRPPNQLSVNLFSDRHRCRLEVANTGESLTQEECEALFKRFYRSDKARSRDGSFGLGLAIAKAIVERHHGKLGVKSKEGWNTFFLELPLNQGKTE